MAAKDNLKDLLQERFSDHAMDVDPGVWQAISGQLASAAAPDGLSDLLKERFKDHAVDVDPGVWNSISGQLGHGAAAGAAGGSGFGGWLAAGLAAAVVTGGVLLWTLSPGSPAATPVATTAPQVPTVNAPVPPVHQEPQAGTTGMTVAQSPASAIPDKAMPGAQPDARFTVDNKDRGTAAAPSGPVDLGEDTGNRADEHGIETVNAIMSQLYERTLARPEIAQTESIPGVGLVQGQLDPEPAPAATATEQPEEAFPAAPPVLWIPNAFSPGMRDGVNDVLEVRAENITNINVRIYYALDSRLVFSANDLKAWDGRDLNGQACPQGYYFYAIEGLDGDGRPFTKGQTIYLFR